jgi:hypothetical protein
MPGSSADVVRVPARASRTGASVFVALIAFLLVAVFKPWGSSGPSSSPSPVTAARGSAGVALAEPAPAPSAGPGEIVCAPSGWQVVTLDRMANYTVRTWIPAAPVSASGPLDPTIPTIRLESPEVLSIGVCGSNEPASSPLAVAQATVVVAAWTTTPGALRSLAISTAQGERLDSRLARLYAPVGKLTAAATWPMGHFVLELAPLAGAGAVPGAGGSSPRWYIGVTVPAPGPPS